MATTRRTKVNIEFLLVKAELTGKAIGSLTILVRA